MVSAAAEMITCAYCAIEFAEDRGQPTCRSCPLSRGCAQVRCPNCGYENPVTPAWVQKLRKWMADQ